jgi:hypothetical protein
MTTIHFVLILFALVSFLVAATGAPTGRVNCIALGLAFWVATLLIPR